jgi:hypothetical protein
VGEREGRVAVHDEEREQEDHDDEVDDDDEDDGAVIEGVADDVDEKCRDPLGAGIPPGRSSGYSRWGAQ